MATKKTTKTPSKYIAMSVKDLQKAHQKLESEYQTARSQGKLGAVETARIKRERARLLTELNNR